MSGLACGSHWFILYDCSFYLQIKTRLFSTRKRSVHPHDKQNLLQLKASECLWNTDPDAEYLQPWAQTSAEALNSILETHTDSLHDEILILSDPRKNPASPRVSSPDELFLATSRSVPVRVTGFTGRCWCVWDHRRSFSLSRNKRNVHWKGRKLLCTLPALEESNLINQNKMWYQIKYLINKSQFKTVNDK